MLNAENVVKRRGLSIYFWTVMDACQELIEKIFVPLLVSPLTIPSSFS